LKIKKEPLIAFLSMYGINDSTTLTRNMHV